MNLDINFVGPNYKSNSYEGFLFGKQIMSNYAFSYAKRPLIVNSRIYGKDILRSAYQPILFNSELVSDHPLGGAIAPIDIKYFERDKFIIFNGIVYTADVSRFPDRRIVKLDYFPPVLFDDDSSREMALSTIDNLARVLAINTINNSSLPSRQDIRSMIRDIMD